MDNKEVCFRMCSSIFITSEFHVSVLFALYVHVVCVCVCVCICVCVCVCVCVYVSVCVEVCFDGIHQFKFQMSNVESNLIHFESK